MEFKLFSPYPFTAVFLIISLFAYNIDVLLLESHFSFFTHALEWYMDYRVISKLSSMSYPVLGEIDFKSCVPPWFSFDKWLFAILALFSHWLKRNKKIPPKPHAFDMASKCLASPKIASVIWIIWTSNVLSHWWTAFRIMFAFC